MSSDKILASSFNSMTDNWKNYQSYDNVKNYIHDRIKSPSLLNTSLMPVNTILKRMYCHDCREYTDSIEPIIIRRYNTYVFAILSLCNKCQKLKQCSISDEYHVKFSSYYFDLKSSKFYMNEIEYNNGIKHKLDKDLFYIINEPSRET